MTRQELDETNFIKIYRGCEDVNPSIEFITSRTENSISTIDTHNAREATYVIGGSADKIRLSKLWRIEAFPETEAMEHMERMQSVYKRQALGAQQTAIRLQEFSDKYTGLKNMAQEKTGIKPVEC